MQFEEIKRKVEENRGLFEELTAITGLDIKSFDGVQDVYSTLQAEVCFVLFVILKIKTFVYRKILI